MWVILRGNAYDDDPSIVTTHNRSVYYSSSEAISDAADMATAARAGGTKDRYWTFRLVDGTEIPARRAVETAHVTGVLL